MIMHEGSYCQGGSISRNDMRIDEKLRRMLYEMMTKW